MHLTEGKLRAYRDHEIHGDDRERVRAHLDTCARCREQVDVLSSRASQVNERLAILAPGPHEAPQVVSAARARLDSRILEKETTMLGKIFTRRYRAAWMTVGLVAILSIALVFPPVQAIANSFLGLFRVQQITVVQINPGNLPEQLGSASQLEYMFSQDLQIEVQGEPQEVANADEASALAGLPVRLPLEVEGVPNLMVQPGGRLTINIDLGHVQALLDEIGRSDIRLPAALDGAQVTVDIPSGVTAMYGECDFDPDAAHQEGYDPDDPQTPRLPRCTTLVQMPSPSVSAPPGLNIAQIGEAFLQVLGMTPEEAAHFSQNIDWTTTLVVPIPRYGTTYQDVAVDGVEGTLIEQDFEDQAPQYMLMWVKDGIVYTLTGPGIRRTALRIANSLK